MDNNSIPIYPGRSVIGSCSICGGPVTVHTIWHCVIPDTPRCEQCGAVKKEEYRGPVIPMVPAQPMRWSTTDATLSLPDNPHEKQT